MHWAHHLGAEAAGKNAIATGALDARRTSVQLSRAGVPLIEEEADRVWAAETNKRVKHAEEGVGYHARMRRKYERAWYWSWLTGVEPDPPPPTQ
jgi:hypothetical protein